MRYKPKCVISLKLFVVGLTFKTRYVTLLVPAIRDWL